MVAAMADTAGVIIGMVRQETSLRVGAVVLVAIRAMVGKAVMGILYRLPLAKAGRRLAVAPAPLYYAGGSFFYVGAAGGGVGLRGQGSSGAVPPADKGGKGGSGGADGGDVVVNTIPAGGAYGGAKAGQRGGATSYKNAIPVMPGTNVTIVVAGNGGARILWGDGRFYPSTNTGDA